MSTSNTHERIVAALICSAVSLLALRAGAEAPQAPADGALELSKQTFARKIEKRLPVEEVERVSADGGRVYCYVELANTGSPQRITLEWERAGKVRFRHSLNVGRGKTWRTWGFISARRPTVGEWTVTVRDEKSAVLGSKQLVIEAS